MLGTKIIPLGATPARIFASCPAHEDMVTSGHPRSLAAVPTALRTRTSRGTGGSVHQRWCSTSSSYRSAQAEAAVRMWAPGPAGRRPPRGAPHFRGHLGPTGDDIRRPGRDNTLSDGRDGPTLGSAGEVAD